MNVTLQSKLLWPSLVFSFAGQLRAAPEYYSVVRATKSILAGRTFESDDGTRLEFSPLKVHGTSCAEMTVSFEYPDGMATSYHETIVNDLEQVRVEQRVGDTVTGNFLVSVELPFNVLRIRPINAASTNFISRECIYQENYEMHVCYIKIKSENDVLVSIFRETTK